MAQEALGPVARALHILRALAEVDQPQSATELAAGLGLPSSTAHRLLQLLREHGMVEIDPVSRRYRPGLEYFRLGALVVAKQPVVETARPFMQELVERVNESCLLGLYLPQTHKMMFADQVESAHTLRFAITTQVPIEIIWGCSGRVILAHLPKQDVASALEHAGPSPVLGTPPPTLEDLEKDLDEIRSQGWDSTRGEKIAESIGLSAPVFTARGIIGSLSLTIPAARFVEQRREQLTRLVTEQAQKLSTALGAAPSSPSAP